MKNLLSILLLLTTTAHAQQYQYTRAEIKHEADSIVRSFVGEDIFRYCVSELDDERLVCYRYLNHKGNAKYHEVPGKGDYTKGDFKDIKIQYRVKYPYPKCIVCDTVRGNTSVMLDRYLRLKLSPDISFIPDYVWEQDSCKHTARHVPLTGKLSHDH